MEITPVMVASEHDFSEPAATAPEAASLPQTPLATSPEEETPLSEDQPTAFADPKDETMPSENPPPAASDPGDETTPYEDPPQADFNPIEVMDPVDAGVAENVAEPQASSPLLTSTPTPNSPQAEILATVAASDSPASEVVLDAESQLPPDEVETAYAVNVEVSPPSETFRESEEPAESLSVPPSPVPPPPPAPTPGTPSSAVYVEASASPILEEPLLLPPPAVPVEEPTDAAVEPHSDTTSIVGPDNVFVAPEDDYPGASPSQDQSEVEFVQEEPQIVEVAPEEVEREAPVEEQRDEAEATVAPRFEEVEDIKPTEVTSPAQKIVAFEPVLPTVEGQETELSEVNPSEEAVDEPENSEAETQSRFKDIPSEVPPIIVTPPMPINSDRLERRSSEIYPEDRLRQWANPRYWILSFKRHRSEKPDVYLKPKKRDSLRARLHSDASLSFLLGRKTSSVVKPIIEDAAKIPRRHNHYTSSKWQSIKRTLSTRLHNFAHKYHTDLAEVHGRLCKDAARDGPRDAKEFHMDRQTYHQLRALHHAELHLRGRKRYTEQEIRAAARHTASAKRHNDKLGHAAKHLREARTNLEKNVERGQNQLRYHERCIRHPIRRLEDEAENGEILLKQVREEINALLRSTKERFGHAHFQDEDCTFDANEKRKIRDAWNREERAQRRLASARERLQNAREHASRESLRRSTESRRGFGYTDGASGGLGAEKLHDRKSEAALNFGTILDGNNPSSPTIHTVDYHSLAESQGMDGSPISIPVATGWTAVRELSRNPAARTPGPGSRLRPRSNKSSSSLRNLKTGSHSSLGSHRTGSQTSQSTRKRHSASSLRSHNTESHTSLKSNASIKSDMANDSEGGASQRRRSSSSASGRSESKRLPRSGEQTQSQLAPSAAMRKMPGSPLTQPPLIESQMPIKRRSWHLRLRQKLCKPRAPKVAPKPNRRCINCPTCGKEGIYPFMLDSTRSLRSIEMSGSSRRSSMESEATVLSDGSTPLQWSSVYRYKPNPESLFGARSFKL